MAKICCSTKVKYNGISFPPFTPFEVAESDTEKLLSKEAWLIEEAVASNMEVLKENEKKPKRKTRRVKKEAE